MTYVWCGAHSLKLPCLWCKTFAEIEALKRGGDMDQNEYQLWERRQKTLDNIAESLFRIADAAEAGAGLLVKIAHPLVAVTEAPAVPIELNLPGAPR